jgi:hypothetical protein
VAWINDQALNGVVTVLPPRGSHQGSALRIQFLFAVPDDAVPLARRLWPLLFELTQPSVEGPAHALTSPGETKRIAMR